MDCIVSDFGFPCGSAGKDTASNVGDLGSIPGLRRSPGEGKDYPLQYSGMENFMDRTVSEWLNMYIHLTERVKVSDVRQVCTLSPFSRVRLFATPWTVARQAPLSIGFSRQEYRSV